MNADMNEGAPILECGVGEDKIIYLVLAGDITASIPSVSERFDQWASKLRQAMVDVSANNNGHVSTLIDVTQLTQFDLTMINRIRELMEFNKQYATKTAIFGASTWISMVVRSNLALTGRTNMRLFSNRDEAVAWLTTDTPSV